MADRFVRVENEGWGSRVGGSLRGVVVGGGLAIAAIGLLFWNEGRAVRRAQALDEGSRSVRSVAANTLDPTLEGKLVHFSGLATSPETLRDVDFRVASDELGLLRVVEMYQWKETKSSKTKKKMGGGTTTTTEITYDKVWDEDVISSSSFEEPMGHENPPFAVESARWTASDVSVGIFRLADTFVSKLGGREALAVRPESVPAQVATRPVRWTGEAFFLGDDPGQPKVGDLRVRFEVVPEGEVSVVGQQQADALVPYTTSNQGTIALLTRGVESAEEMFEEAKTDNKTWTWILRLAGFVALWVGFAMALRPLSVVADVLPFLGTMVGKGTGLLAGLGAAFVSLVVVAVGWIYYRPLLGVSILGLALVVLALIVRKVRSDRRRMPAAPSPPVPAPPAAAPPPPSPPPPAEE